MCQKMFNSKTMAKCNLIDNNINQIFIHFIFSNNSNADAAIFDYTNLYHIYYCMIDLSHNQYNLETISQEQSVHNIVQYIVNFHFKINGKLNDIIFKSLNFKLIMLHNCITSFIHLMKDNGYMILNNNGSVNIPHSSIIVSRIFPFLLNCKSINTPICQVCKYVYVVNPNKYCINMQYPIDCVNYKLQINSVVKSPLILKGRIIVNVLDIISTVGMREHVLITIKLFVNTERQLYCEFLIHTHESVNSRPYILPIFANDKNKRVYNLTLYQALMCFNFCEITCNLLNESISTIVLQPIYTNTITNIANGKNYHIVCQSNIHQIFEQNIVFNIIEIQNWLSYNIFNSYLIYFDIFCKYMHTEYVAILNDIYLKCNTSNFEFANIEFIPVDTLIILKIDKVHVVQVRPEIKSLNEVYNWKCFNDSANDKCKSCKFTQMFMLIVIYFKTLSNMHMCEAAEILNVLIGCRNGSLRQPLDVINYKVIGDENVKMLYPHRTFIFIFDHKMIMNNVWAMKFIPIMQPRVGFNNKMMCKSIFSIFESFCRNINSFYCYFDNDVFPKDSFLIYNIKAFAGITQKKIKVVKSNEAIFTRIKCHTNDFYVDLQTKIQECSNKYQWIFYNISSDVQYLANNYGIVIILICLYVILVLAYVAIHAGIITINTIAIYYKMQMHLVYEISYFGSKDMCGLSRDMDHMEQVYRYPHTNIYHSGKVQDSMFNICIPTIMIPWKLNKSKMHYISPGKHDLTKINVNSFNQIIVCKQGGNTLPLDNNVVIVFAHMNFVQRCCITNMCLDSPIHLDQEIVSTSTHKVECT